MTPIDPRYLDFADWANAMRVQSRNLPIANPGEPWTNWAVQAFQFDPNAPDPSRFTEWRPWALAWLRAL